MSAPLTALGTILGTFQCKARSLSSIDVVGMWRPATGSARLAPMRVSSALVEDAVSKAVGEADAGIVSVYLFGSVAEARAHRHSDVDIGVLLDFARHRTRRERFEARLRLSAEIGFGLHRGDVDVVVLNDAPPHLARHIVTRGRRLYCSDREADHAFTRTAMLRAADLDPFLQRARRVKLKALAR